MLNEVSETRCNDFNFGRLLALLSNENKKKFRRLEKLRESFIKNKFGVIFNQTCLNIFKHHDRVFTNQEIFRNCPYINVVQRIV